MKSYYHERRCGTMVKRDVAGTNHRVGVCVTNGTRITDAAVVVHRDTNETSLYLSFSALSGIAIESHYSHASNVVNHEFLDYRCRFKATVVQQLEIFRPAREIFYIFRTANGEYIC